MLYVFANSRRRQKEAIQTDPMMVEEDGQSDEEVDLLHSTDFGLEVDEGEDEDDSIKGDVFVRIQRRHLVTR